MGISKGFTIWVSLFIIANFHTSVLITALPSLFVKTLQQGISVSNYKESLDNNVPINVQRIRRNQNFHELPTTSDKKSLYDDSTIQINISTPNSVYIENLFKTKNSIFSSNFKFHIAQANSNGKLKLSDETPSAETIAEIENGHFVNPEIGASVSISTPKNNFETEKVSGIFGDITIIHEDDGSYTINEQNPQIYSDYIDLHRNVTPGPSTRSIVTSEPEVYIIFDYENYKTFNGSVVDIIDYIGVFFNGINNRFATISDPKITFRIAGIVAVSSPSLQPYMENHKTPDGKGNDISKVLLSFSKWIHSNKKSLPNHDMAIILTGRDMYYRNSAGKLDSSSAGVAYLKGACWTIAGAKQFMGVSVGEDIGGYYDGVFTMAHELAHLLGAPHDGILEASRCSWNDGYIMSYAGWGKPNKFAFSPCSSKIMKDFILSSGGTCLRSIQNSSPLELPKEHPGDRVGMKELCTKAAKHFETMVGTISDVVVDTVRSPSDLCKRLACQGNSSWGYIRFLAKSPIPPGDNTPCGNEGGHCWNGECVK